MKFLVQQLQKYRQSPLVIDEQVDLSAPAKENFADRLLDLLPIHVTGEISYEKNDQIKLDLLLKGTAVLPSARSFKPVQYQFEIPVSELYVQDEETLDTFDQSEQVFLVEKNQIDLDAIILENIVTDLPMTAYTPEETADNPIFGDGWQIISDENYVAPKWDLQGPQTQSLGDFFPDEPENKKDR
ncbi:MAG: DUF177 domain-containing protein [Oenococcus sp.]|uniref:YceD family protein n=1 Tax=Oenococcus sp. TaxID=1979414 RepID=UPI0039EBC53D